MYSNTSVALEPCLRETRVMVGLSMTDQQGAAGSTVMISYISQKEKKTVPAVGVEASKEICPRAYFQKMWFRTAGWI